VPNHRKGQQQALRPALQAMLVCTAHPMLLGLVRPPPPLLLLLQALG
jgi:hypothetical protein